MGDTTETRQPLRTTIPLRYRKILKKSFSSFIKVFFIGGFIALCVVLFLEGGMGDLPTRVDERKADLYLILAMVILPVMFWKVVYEYLYFVTYFYDIDDYNVIIRKGIISKVEVTLPFSRITDVYLEQDLYDVMLGLYDVHISTPTQQSGAFAHIDGLNRAGAFEIKSMILERMHKSVPVLEQTPKTA